MQLDLLAKKAKTSMSRKKHHSVNVMITESADMLSVGNIVLLILFGFGFITHSALFQIN